MGVGTIVAGQPQVVAARIPRWAVLGVLFGLLSATSIVLWGPIGVSGTYPRFVGSIMRQLAPAWATANPYLEKMGTVVTPETMLVVGLIIGALVSRAWDRRGAAAPREVAAVSIVHAHETTNRRRYLDAFIGGLLIVFGARLAGGCTSGHIISGIAQLSVSSMIFAAGVFGAGIFTAKRLREGY